ncbi:MAG: rRNA maturation RNase YbeY [Candidatus Daviesbacteria bacterium]
MINIIISSDSRYSINRAAMKMAALIVLQQHHINGQVELEINVVGDRKMHELNRKYRGVNQTTDVLSFALQDPPPINMQLLLKSGFIAAPDNILRLGSIVIAYPQAIQDAAMEGTSVEEEINFLVEHGTTHLLGIHHD